MEPIIFSCEENLPLAPADIARHMLDLNRWPDFHGYGPIPGIKTATFDRQTPGIVGTRIRVTNCDGSSHVEEIVEWQPTHRVQLQMKDFSPPLSRLATRFEETWAKRTGQRIQALQQLSTHSRLSQGPHCRLPALPFRQSAQLKY